MFYFLNKIFKYISTKILKKGGKYEDTINQTRKQKENHLF